jgi:putative ABC transport system permease protein
MMKVLIPLSSELTVDFRIALRNTLRQRRRSALAMLAIGFGVIAMMLASGFIEWIFWANREGTAVTQYGHMQVVKRGYYDSAQADPFPYLLPQAAPILESLKNTSGVRVVTPRLEFTGLISHGEVTLGYMAKGIDTGSDPSLPDLLIVEGEKLVPGNSGEILLGAGLAANLGIKVGERVVLLAGTNKGGINALEARVRGFASTSIKAYDDSMLWLPIDMARKLLRVGGAHIWVVCLRDTELTDTVLSRLQGTVDPKAYEIAPWTKLADFYQKTVDLLSRQLDVIKFIISATILLSISNTMTMTVMERTMEIGTAMALGVRRWRIVRLFLIEGGLLGAIGGLSGALIGFTLATLISYVGIDMPPWPGMSRGFTAAIIITPGIIVEAILLSLAITLLASAYPAWRASRLVIVDALRHKR